MYELLVFILLSLILESGMGIIYGIAVGYNPVLIFPAAIALNFVSIIFAYCIIEKILSWKPNIRHWIERRTERGRKVIDKYGCLGILMGFFVLSPVQLAITGRLLGINPNKLYPTLFGGTLIVAAAFLGVALGIFKILLV
jgi:uncharacterized membrane protein